MTTPIPQPVQFIKTLGGWSDAYIEHGYEKASQTYKKGAPLVYDTGQLKEDTAQTVGLTATSLVGFALSDATGTTAADVQYIAAALDQRFRICVDGGLSGTASPGTGKPSDLTRGQLYGLVKDTASGNWYIDSALAATGNFRLIDYDPDQANVIQGWAIFRLDSAILLP